MPIIVKNINKQNERPHSNRMRSLRFYRKNLYFYVLGELMLSDMLRSKHSYQRNTYTQSSYIIQTKERSVYWHKLQKKEWCQYQLTSLLYRTLFRLSALFLKFLKKFFHRKRQPEIHQIAFLFLMCFNTH